jgi:small subunit ribosomal protein S16
MLVIRLTRVGKKNSPAYRIVVADKQRAVKRKFIEIVGNYNPIQKPKALVIDKERALFWLGRGAQPSDTVRNLMVDLGVLDKDAKATKIYGKAKPKKTPEETEAPKSEPVAAQAVEEEVSAEKPEETVAEETPETTETSEAPAEEKAETGESAPETAEKTEAAVEPEATEEPTEEKA